MQKQNTDQKIIYRDGDKVRSIRGRLIKIDEHGLLHFDTGYKLILLPINQLLRIEECGVDE